MNRARKSSASMDTSVTEGTDMAKVRQRQRLEALGALAGGVAHEINNPIQSIMNYAQLIKNRGKSPQLDEYAGEILHEAQRVATIVRNLQSFARQEGEPYTEALMSDMVAHTLSLTAAVLRKEQIEVSVDVSEDLPPVPCHPQQVQQVIMNLVTHSRDALNARYPHGGPSKRMKIAARVLQGDQGPLLRTEIEDLSLGLPQAALDRLFDPFDAGANLRGSGLGLALCESIAADHGGTIAVESVEGQYLRFLFDLPVAGRGRA